MKNGDIRVLLVGETTNSFRRLKKSLGRRHCRYQTATSYEEAHRLIGEEMPDFVLSALRPRPGAISSLTERLSGSPASFYYAYPVEDGCWWLPALERGERCLGAPALRSTEFTRVFDSVLGEIRAEREAEQKLTAPASRPARRAKVRKPVQFAYEKAAS